MIQTSLGLICEDCVFLKLDTFTNPVWDLFFWFSCSSSFLVISLITSWKYLLEGFLGWCYRHTGTWHNLQCSTTALQNPNSQRVGHGRPQSRLMQLPMTPHLHSGNFFRPSYFICTVNFKISSPCLLISLLPQLSFEGVKDSYFGVVGLSSVDL